MAEAPLCSQRCTWLDGLENVPPCPAKDTVSGEGENLGNQEKLVHKDKEGLGDGIPGGDISQDQRRIGLSGGSSSSV